MRFNAVIAAYILAATVSGAALPVAEASAEAVAAPEAPAEDTDAPDGGEFAFGDDDDFEIEFEKRSAEPGWTWYVITYLASNFRVY